MTVASPTPQLCAMTPTSEQSNTQSLTKIPGNIAVWILIYAELSEFGLFFIAFLITRVHYPDVFSDGPLQLNTAAGTVNTLVLITSSFFVAKAMAAMKKNQRQTCLKWLWLTLAMGATYCVVKTWEYHWNHNAGIGAKTNSFFALYYYLTFNHLLHVLMGMCTILFVTIRVHLGDYDSENHEGLEAAASYWHMIDLVWIIIFPLLYVLR
jgi:cytochrome c oxidase subunit III